MKFSVFECRATFIFGLRVARRPVGLHRGCRALLGQWVKRPGGGYAVIRRHWAPLACPGVADAVRRLGVVVVTPESFVECYQHHPAMCQLIRRS